MGWRNSLKMNINSIMDPGYAASAEPIFMTSNIQLGNLCARVGKKLELNEEGVITNDPAVNELAWREPRKGWGAIVTKV
jgi:hypothetical protein